MIMRQQVEIESNSCTLNCQKRGNNKLKIVKQVWLTLRLRITDRKCKLQKGDRFFQAVVSMTLLLSFKSELLPSHEAVPIPASILDSRQSREIQSEQRFLAQIKKLIANLSLMSIDMVAMKSDKNQEYGVQHIEFCFSRFLILIFFH